MRNQKQIIQDFENGLSIDVIVGKYINKTCSNKDQILKVIKEYRWNKLMNKGNK